MLRVDFDLVMPKSMKQIKHLLEEQQPDVVLASTHQKKGHGLSLCTRMRKLDGGDCLMVVHGSAPEGVDAEKLKLGLGSDFKVDHWLHNNASPALVALTVKQLLKAQMGTRPRRRRRAIAPPASMSTSSGQRRASQASVRTTGEFEVEFRRPPVDNRDT